MKVQTGYLYYIKDEFFDKINGKGLMINHGNGLNLFFTDIDNIKEQMLEEVSN